MQPVVESYKNPVGSTFYEQMAQRVGIESFHDFQKQAIAAVKMGRDTFLVVPTGSGKSLCYIVPSLFLPGLVVVVSPLIALMRDQQRHLEKMGIPSLSFDSHLDADEKKTALRKIARQEIRVLYISPERLALNGFREMLKALPIALIAVDEAHCVAQWGQGFRPEYARLGTYLAEFASCPKMALTATVTPRERDVIAASLGMKDYQFITVSSVRENLDIKIYRYSSVQEQRQSIIDTAAQRDDQGIIYASTRKNVEDIHQALKARRLPVGLYHGGMQGDMRNRSQQNFMSGKTSIMVATKAFGMGINLPSIRYVFHANMPCSIESYTQEIGRAGRDGYLANCDLHYGPRDYYLQKFMIEKSFPSDKDLPKLWRFVEENLVDKKGIRQESLIQALTMQAMLPLDVVVAAVDFFIKDQALRVEETWNEEDGYLFETYVVIHEEFRGLNSLLQGLSEQVAWRFEKLNAMHKLIKESASPRLTIEKYFQ